MTATFIDSRGPFSPSPSLRTWTRSGAPGRRPVVAAGAILGAQEARAADADIDEGGIEIGHHPLEPAEEHALDPRRAVAAHDLQLDQAALGDQRHQERLGQHVTDQPVDLAHGWAAFNRVTVSNSGRPTTLL